MGHVRAALSQGARYSVGHQGRPRFWYFRLLPYTSLEQQLSCIVKWDIHGQANFFVALTSGANAVAQRIKAEFDAEDVYKLADDKWFLVYDGISRELAEDLKIRSAPHIGAGVVMPVDSYSGRATAQLWEWLKLQMGRQ